MFDQSTSSSQLYLGLMSGTSLDGVDAVLVDFSNKTPKLVCSYSHQISSTLKARLIKTIQPNWIGSLEEIGVLNQQLGQLFADAANALLESNGIDKSSISAIGSQG